jgi:hypothetical protein
MARLDRAIQQARVGAPMSLYRLDGPLLRAMTALKLQYQKSGVLAVGVP